MLRVPDTDIGHRQALERSEGSNAWRTPCVGLRLAPKQDRDPVIEYSLGFPALGLGVEHGTCGAASSHERIDLVEQRPGVAGPVALQHADVRLAQGGKRREPFRLGACYINHCSLLRSSVSGLPISRRLSQMRCREMSTW